MVSSIERRIVPTKRGMSSILDQKGSVCLLTPSAALTVHREYVRDDFEPPLRFFSRRTYLSRASRSCLDEPKIDVEWSLVRSSYPRYAKVENVRPSGVRAYTSAASSAVANEPRLTVLPPRHTWVVYGLRRDFEG